MMIQGAAFLKLLPVIFIEIPAILYCNSVIGGDFKEFCDEVIANLPSKTAKEKLCDGLDIFCSCMAVLGVITIGFSKDVHQMIGAMVAHQPVGYHLGTSLGTIISTTIILIAAVLIVQVLTKNSLRKSNSSSKRKKMVIGAVAGAGFVALFIMIAKLGTQIVFSIHLAF